MVAAAAFIMTSCSDDDSSPSALKISSAKSGSKNLYGTTSATDVPVDSTISVTFAREIDAATATSSTVMLKMGGTTVASVITASGSTIWINPNSALMTGTNYSIRFMGVKAKDGGALSNTDSIAFKSYGAPSVTPPQATNLLAYWNFNNTATEANNSTDYTTAATVDLTYGKDRFGYDNGAASFNGTTSIIEVNNGDKLLTPSNALSFWVYTDSTGGHTQGHFPMGVGDLYGFFVELGMPGALKQTANFKKSDGSNSAQDMWYNGSGEDKDNGGWIGWDYRLNINASAPGAANGVGALMLGKWTHVVFTYDAAAKIQLLYLNGVLSQRNNYANVPDAGGPNTFTGFSWNANAEVTNKLAFGFNHDRASTHWSTEPWGGYTFPGANHFKGRLDDVRFWKAALTPAEITALYNSEK